MKAAGILLKLLDGIVTLLGAVLFVTALVWSAYSFWDNRQVVTDVREVQRSLRDLRPTADDEEGSGTDFRKLQEANADICAWLTLEGTEIDSAVVQGKDNGTYMHTDPYGKPALGGSIFLDARNSRQFEDAVHVLYGHNVRNEALFADLNKYKDFPFFEGHREGRLLVPGREWKLHVFACLRTREGEKLIFDPEYAAENRSLFLDYAEEHAAVWDREMLKEMRENGEKILTMTTCTDDGDQDARTAVLAWMEAAA
ncbi:MAG: class B sortase [Oscillospiraceae bacterium]|nr:class B sortase [Oscillospiraceae bacterium]